MPDPGNVKLSLEYIRRKAGYASDIAEIALKETIDEVTEKRTAPREETITITIIIISDRH